MTDVLECCRPKRAQRAADCARPGWPAALLTLVCSLGPLGAHAEVVDLAWDRSGHFRRDLSVAPGRFAELCGALSKGQNVDWSFEGTQAMDFDIHYHQGQTVVFRARKAGVKKAAGRLDVRLAQDYCWMWRNTSDHPVELQVTLLRR